MNKKILIIGAGFGGLELSSSLADALPGQIDITLIDKNDAFVFGFLKYDLMFGRATLPERSLYYRDITRSGVEFRQETVIEIDPANRRVTTDRQTYEPDILVVALGAEYDIEGTPGFAEGGHEFYSIPGALALKDVLPNFTSGSLVVGVIGQPYKCPPAPSETVILLDEFYRQRGNRDDIKITLVSQWVSPLPPSPNGTQILLDTFKEKNISFVPEQVITSLDPEKKVAITKDGNTYPYDLFLGIPLHCVPKVVADSGLSEDGWIPVDDKHLTTKFPGVYAIGDVTSAPVPKAGVFAESAAHAVASHLVAELTKSGDVEVFSGIGTCYVDFGDGKIGRVNANFPPGKPPSAPFTPPSEELFQEKEDFVTVRRKRWLTG